MSAAGKQGGTCAARIVRTAGYWIVSLTWGSIMTLLGAVIALVMLLTGHRPGRLGPNVYFEVGRGWGGMEYGAFFFVETGENQEGEKTFTFQGGGFGHGAGMSQNGASGMAAAGYDYQEIISFFYPGTTLHKLYS